MSKRLELQKILETLAPEVYFQPPSTIQMNYPAIVYSRSKSRGSYANNKLYKHIQGYMVTVIDPNPDSEIPDRVLELPMCRFNRHYKANNLNHDVFDIYY